MKLLVVDDERDEGYDESNNNVVVVCVGSVVKDCTGVCGCSVLNHCVDMLDAFGVVFGGSTV